MNDWLYSKVKIIEKLKQKGIRLSKSRGQNFLLDKNILNKMISCVDFNGISNIIEIGPGIGNLTNFLVDLKKDVYLIELDYKLYEIIKERYLHYNNVHIINKDFLKIDLEKTINSGKTIVVSNIPYNLTSRIIEKCFYYSNIIKELYLLMQKELSERIIASEGNKIFGSLSIFVQTFSKVEILFNVSKNVFFPIPKVNSSFIKFKLLSNSMNIDIHKYSYFLKNIFSYRRKKIGNVLSKYILMDHSKLEIKKQLEENIGIDSEKRPEEISVEKYKDIYKFYEELIDFPLL